MCWVEGDWQGGRGAAGVRRALEVELRAGWWLRASRDQLRGAKVFPIKQRACDSAGCKKQVLGSLVVLFGGVPIPFSFRICSILNTISVIAECDTL